MAWKTALLAGVLAAPLARAAQPGAAAPVEAPMRDLQWGQLNFLHTTDTHGWHGGHLQEPQYSADWGDYISFTEHLRKRADDEGVDLLLVDTGDRVEGNGLYDSSSPKGKYTYDIYREQHMDVICTGNHELYQADTADREHTETVPNYKHNYVASNLDYIDPKTGKRTPMAQRYRKFQTKNQKLTVVAFGFLFDFRGNANNTAVQPVEETVKEEWFQQAIREQADLFVVIGHVGVHMEEFKNIFTVIRKQNWFTPIAFFGGHVHVRDSTAYDARSFALGSGRYFETIGWMSIDGIEKKTKNVEAEAKVSTAAAATTLTFQRRYIDNNLFGLRHHSGRNETTFPTEHGRNVSREIARARKALDLDERFGCAPRDYWMSRTPYDAEDSVYSWLQNEVLPNVTVSPGKRDPAIPRLSILNTGTIRFDIFKGAFTRDSTYIVSPFTSALRYIPDVPYAVAKKVLPMLNSGGQILGAGPEVPDPRFLAVPEQWSRTESIIVPPRIPKAAEPVGGQQRPLFSDDDTGGGEDDGPALVQGYTTKDDIGTDGDDAVHAPISFYMVPNCIQAEVGFPPAGAGEPDKVDVVFLDFIQPWLVLALRFSGGDYSNDDVKPYIEGKTFTDLMAGWIKENWGKRC